ncbi:metal-dependent hydrolase (plasmid) [Acidithiobacillus ferriphilus]|uniref:metal-dependent hydrolase n=1 Tax=Acidithiobacillus ferriphilus TaxID=1689834 RepID=UPI00390C4FD4
MNQIGHHITAASMAAAGAACALPYCDVTQIVVGVIAALGGASAPDWLEGAFRIPLTGKTIRLIPHRTLTHLPWIWAITILVGISHLPSAWGIAVAAFAAAGLLHLAMDLLSPMGIPLLIPFAARTSLHGYRVGAISEAVTIVATSGTFVAIAAAIFSQA